MAEHLEDDEMKEMYILQNFYCTSIFKSTLTERGVALMTMSIVSLYDSHYNQMFMFIHTYLSEREENGELLIESWD